MLKTVAGVYCVRYLKEKDFVTMLYKKFIIRNLKSNASVTQTRLYGWGRSSVLFMGVT